MTDWWLLLILLAPVTPWFAAWVASPSLFARLEISERGLTLRGLRSNRSIAWTDIEHVRIRRQLELHGKDSVLHVPRNTPGYAEAWRALRARRHESVTALEWSNTRATAITLLFTVSIAGYAVARGYHPLSNNLDAQVLGCAVVGCAVLIGLFALLSWTRWRCDRKHVRWSGLFWSTTYARTRILGATPLKAHSFGFPSCSFVAKTGDRVIELGHLWSPSAPLELFADFAGVYSGRLTPSRGELGSLTPHDPPRAMHDWWWIPLVVICGITCASAIRDHGADWTVYVGCSAGIVGLLALTIGLLTGGTFVWRFQSEGLWRLRPTGWALVRANQFVTCEPVQKGARRYVLVAKDGRRFAPLSSTWRAWVQRNWLTNPLFQGSCYRTSAPTMSNHRDAVPATPTRTASDDANPCDGLSARR